MDRRERREALLQVIKSQYTALLERPLQVYEVFKDFYEEANVDLQYKDIEVAVDNVALYDLSEIKGISIAFDSLVEKIKSSNTVPTNMYEFSDEDFEDYINLLKRCRIPLFININIMIHFPSVRITNEHDKYVDITHLYAKVPVSSNGHMNGVFSLNRAEYPIQHMISDYMHSHCLGIPFENFANFRNPCLGHGPIVSTVSTLNREYNLDIWQLFCVELSKYITVESLDGVPYRHLERIGNNTSNSMSLSFSTIISYRNNALSDNEIKDFITYLINKKKLKFSYINNQYSIGMSFIDYIILISNEFIEWYNYEFIKGNSHAALEVLLREKMLHKAIITNNSISFDKKLNSHDYNEYEGALVCRFKGKDVKLHIIQEDLENANYSFIVDRNFALNILYIVLKTLNHRYGNKRIETDKKVKYLF